MNLILSYVISFTVSISLFLYVILSVVVFWKSRYNIQYRTILGDFLELVSLSLIVETCQRINKLIHNPRRIRLRAQYLSFSCRAVFFTLRINLALLLVPSFKSPLSVNVLPETREEKLLLVLDVVVLWFFGAHPFSSTLFYFDSYRNYGKLTEESPSNV